MTTLSSLRYTNRDPLTAETALGRLRALYPESDETNVVELQLENYVRNADSSWGRGESISLMIQSTVIKDGGIPREFSLHQNYPNPFNPSTTIKYDLPVDANVSLKIYDMLGREVFSLVDGFETAGYHQTSVDGTKLASGVYFYTIRSGSFTDVKKLLLLK